MSSPVTNNIKTQIHENFGSTYKGDGSSFGLHKSDDALLHQGRALLATGKFSYYCYNPIKNEVDQINVPPVQLSKKHLAHGVFISNTLNERSSFGIEMTNAQVITTNRVKTLASALQIATQNVGKNNQPLSVNVIYSVGDNASRMPSLPPRMAQPIIRSKL